ncbi:MAG: M28 family peptidase [Planctomycetota bacterium]
MVIRALAGFTAAVLLSCAALEAQRDVRGDLARIRATMEKSDAFEPLLGELCDRIGPRLTGSDGYESAARFVAAKLSGGGLAVRTESMTIEEAWQRGAVRARIVEPIRRELTALAAPWTPAIERTVLRVTLPGSRVRSQGGAEDAVPLATLFRQHELAGVAAAEDPREQVAAWLIDSERPRALLAAAACTLAPPFTRGKVPGVFLSSEDHALLHRLLAAGDEVRIELAGGGEFGGRKSVSNVIAEVRGEPGEVHPERGVVLAIVGLDSWDLGSGATMDGAGVVVAMEVARALAAMPSPPRHSIRFAFLAGVRQGVGSRSYVERFADDLGRHRLAFALEGGAGRAVGLLLDGPVKDLDRFEGFCAPVADLGVRDIGFRAPRTNFARALRDAKVRAATLTMNAPEFGWLDGTAADTLDKVLIADLRQAATVLATVLWSAANE